MKVKRIVYRRKFNLGDYSNEDIDIEAEVQDGDDIKEVFKQLKKETEDMHRGE